MAPPRRRASGSRVPFALVGLASVAACGGADAGALSDGTRIAWALALGGPGDDALERLATDASGRGLVAIFHEEPLSIGGTTFPAAEVPSLALATVDVDGEPRPRTGIAPSPAEIYSSDIARDELGNVYVGGFLTGGALEVSDVVLEPSGGTGFDGYLMRIGPDEEIRWAARYGGPASVELDDLGLTPGGQLWVVGDYRGTFELGGLELPPADGFDVFAARISPTGTALDVVVVGGPKTTRATAMAVAPDGGLVLAGVFEDAVRAGDLEGSDEASGGWSARIGPEAGVEWLETYSERGGARSVSAVAASDRRVIVAGSYSGTLVDPESGDRPGRGGNDVWIRVLTAAGELVGQRTFGSPDDEGLSALALDGFGDIWAAGSFANEITFGSFELASDASAGDRAFAGWIARLDDALVPEHASVLGRGDGSRRARQLVTVPGGDILVGGPFQGRLVVGDATLESAGATDVVLLRLNRGG